MSDDAWIDTFIQESLLRLAEAGLSADKKREVLDQIPLVRQWLRKQGPPLSKGLDLPDVPIRCLPIGEPGVPIRRSITESIRTDLEKRALAFRAEVLARHGRSGWKAAQRDAWCAGAGQELLQTCSMPEDKERFLCAGAARARMLSPQNEQLFLNALADDVATEAVRAAALWSKNGYPLVRIADPKYAASLMCTSVPGELADQVHPPWSSFRVAIPPGLLWVDDAGRRDACTRLMVSREVGGTWTILCEGDVVQIHVAGQRTEDLCEDIDVEEMNTFNDRALSLSDTDGRVLRCASRLVLGICLAFDRATTYTPQRVRKRETKTRCARDPILRKYVLRRPVVVRDPAKDDVRCGLTRYLEGKRRSSPSTQTLVRGHWKNQPCGPGGKGRKFIHIEPYWRGPEDAPIAVRPHVLKRAPAAP